MSNPHEVTQKQTGNIIHTGPDKTQMKHEDLNTWNKQRELIRTQLNRVTNQISNQGDEWWQTENKVNRKTDEYKLKIHENETN